MEPQDPDRPWKADRVLSEDGIRAAIASQFPGVDLGRLEHIGSGFEYDAYRTADDRVFRFPRRVEHAGTFRWESGVHGLVADRLRPVAVPRVELWGRPGPYFPYAFTGHRLVPGRPADDPGIPESADLAAELGEALSRIHSVPAAEARNRGVMPAADGPAEWLAEVRENAPTLRGLDTAVDAALEWIERRAEVPPDRDGPPRLLHNDLCPDHILVDPDSGRLTGILDWTDAALGDPAFDFIVLVAWRGWRFFERVRKVYTPELDPDFDRRVAFLARVSSIDWLWEAREREADANKHIRWVANAFSAPRLSDARA